MWADNMYLDDLDKKLNYKNISTQKRNKALNAKIKYIPSHGIFNITMYRLGINQRYRQSANLITNMDEFNINEFAKNNEFRLSKQTIVFEDYIDERKFNIPKGKIVEIYTRLTKRRTNARHSTSVLDVAYLMDGSILVINRNE